MIEQVKYNNKSFGFSGRGITTKSAKNLCGGTLPSMGSYIQTGVGAVYNWSGSYYLIP